MVRPAIIYGIGDKLGLSKFVLLSTMHSLCPVAFRCCFAAPRLIIGAVYRQLQEKMKVSECVLMWSGVSV